MSIQNFEKKTWGAFLSEMFPKSVFIQIIVNQSPMLSINIAPISVPSAA